MRCRLILIVGRHLILGLVGLIVVTWGIWTLHRFGPAPKEDSPVPPPLVPERPSASINLKYMRYVRPDPLLSAQDIERAAAAWALAKRADANAFPAAIRFCRDLRIDQHTSLNSLLHVLMTFGPDEPVTLDSGERIGVLTFLRNYYDFLPSDIRLAAPEWIVRVGGQAVYARVGMFPRVLVDHPGQLQAYCAFADVSEDVTFKTKSGQEIALRDLVDYELTNSDPDTWDPAWLTIVAERYRAQTHWRNVAGRPLSPDQFLASDLACVGNHSWCGGTHPLISAAYCLARRTGGHARNEMSVDDLDRSLRTWAEVVRQTTYEDGTVSRTWMRGSMSRPLSRQEIIVINAHTLEWLARYLDPRELQSEWVRKIAARFCIAVGDLCVDSQPGEVLPFNYAALCHGVDGLLSFERRLKTQ